MAANRKFDILLGNHGFMLARPAKGLARAWQRSGLPDTPSVEQPRVSTEFGGLPPQIEYPEVWNDWSGGFGYAYRHPKDENSYFGFLANPNTYHWAENFDPRFARQLVHAQKLVTVTALNVGADQFMDSPFPSGSDAGSVLALTNTPAGFGPQIDQAFFLAPNDKSTVVDAPVSFNLISSSVALLGNRPAIFGSYHYIPVLDGSGFFAIDFLAATATQSALPAMGFEVAGNRLWRAHGPSPSRPIWLQSLADVSLTAAFSATAWSATLSVGDSYQPILDMIALEDQLFVGKWNGLYAGNQSGSFVNVLSELGFRVHPDNCRDLTIYDHQVIVPHVSGLYAYQPSTTSPRAVQIGPQGLSNKSPIHGRFRTVRGLGQWLYGGYYNGSSSYIMAGYDPRSGEPWTWHPMQKLPLAGRVNRIHFDGVAVGSNLAALPGRMWVSMDSLSITHIGPNQTSQTYIHRIPQMNDNPLLPDISFTASFANSARMDLGNTDGRSPTTPKLYRSAEVWADNLDGSQRWGLLYYTVDQGARTLLGTVNTSPKSVVYFPHADGSFVMGQSIELSLESYIAAGAEATSPVYRSVVLRQAQVPRSVDVIAAIIDVGDNFADRQGTPMRAGAVQLAELRGMAATGPVQLVDLVGASSWVKVQSPVAEQEMWQEGASNPSVLATIKLAVLSFSGP